MKYIKANETLPEDLLKEVQKYVQGELLYIPKQKGVRKKWGENSGYRNYLICRNDEIYKKYHQGTTIEQLSIQYSLSCDSIKKIVYSKK
ncbi:CD3324 family protein [Paenibacillus faecalis]|uniref:CD3324 family protein n=1 Tax=Paenibacillus faecalis TaxID=2079532 RepID=UPI000D0EBC68|nr:CD3324 family protein [Paenibacillus faecalis]